MQYGSFTYGGVEYGGQQTPIVVPAPPVGKRFTLFIGGIDQTSLMLVNTLQITNRMSQATTCVFALRDPAGAYHPTIGQDIQVFSNTTKIFGGTIDETTETAYQARPDVRVDVKCSDYSMILDRRIVGAWYPGQILTGLTTVVSGLVNSFLAGDGIVYDTRDGDPGIGLGDQLFQWITARQAFSQLASAVNWDFQIDFNKVLRFFPKGTGLSNAPFNIADNDGNVLAVGGSGGTGQSASIRTYRGTYANRFYITSSSQASALWIDIFSKTQPGPFPNSKQPPGGGRIAFFTLYPLDKAPTIVVNGSQVATSRIITLAQVAGAAPGSWDWYWIPPQASFPHGGNGVFQNQANAPLGVNDVLEVDYQTQLSPVTVATCTAEVAARATAEGNSGFYDAVEQAPNITDPVAITNYANLLLNRYGCVDSIPRQVIYSTIKDGLSAGMLQTINLSQPLVASHSYLITQVVAKDVDKDHIEYQVTCDSGSYQAQTAAEFFASLLRRGSLAQPGNRQTYTWQLAQTVGGVTNPGITTGTQPVIHMCQNQVEVCQYLSITPNTGNATNAVSIQLTINGNGTVLSYTFPIGSAGGVEVRVYNPPSQGALKIFAGDKLQILVQGAPDAAMKDVNVTLVTSVGVT